MRALHFFAWVSPSLFQPIGQHVSSSAAVAAETASAAVTAVLVTDKLLRLLLLLLMLLLALLLPLCVAFAHVLCQVSVVQASF
jgi:uncharacterized membrane protein